MRKGQRRDASQAAAIFLSERKRNTESASWSCSDFWKREKNREKVREWIRIFFFFSARQFSHHSKETHKWVRDESRVLHAIKDDCVGGYAREPIKKICKYFVSLWRVMGLRCNFNPLVECGYCILPFDEF